jgi:hypothetical protein
MPLFTVPLIIRGQVTTAPDLEFSGRREAGFSTPDVARHMSRLALASPSAMADLYELRFQDVVDYLADLGDRLSFERNPYLQQAFESSVATSGLSESILKYCYQILPTVFAPDTVREIAARAVGIPYLDGWVPETLANGTRVATRAFGARCVHIVAGNVPIVSAITVVRNAITRGDAIIKTPSNDPLTAAAIARTMIDAAPAHPLTRHLSVAYWKGGNAQVEDALYHPRHLEKILAWGGLASVAHIARYIQPGIDLITFDPKLSSTIIGAEAFADERAMTEVAACLARDVGVMNQEACVNARVVYVQSGTDPAGLERINRLGAKVLEAIRRLPLEWSSPTLPSLELRDEIEVIRSGGGWQKVYGGGDQGTVIVSQSDEPVEFAAQLANRVVNLVPVDDLDVAVRAVNAYTQTIGVYPGALRERLRDRLALHGAQRLVTLGYATMGAHSQPQDAFEPLRRMCRWVSDEDYDVAQELRIGGA